MKPTQENIHPIFAEILDREAKEQRLRQRGCVIWLYGLSGSGKSTLANALERRLFEEGFTTKFLDGDNIRTGLNGDLGFSNEERRENIRRIAEVAKLFVQAGVIAINSFITPKNELRAMAREIIGDADLLEIYLKCSFETCAERDVKGLYAKVEEGKIQQFTGRDSAFEAPDKPDLILQTDQEGPESSLEQLYQFVRPKLRKD